MKMFALLACFLTIFLWISYATAAAELQLIGSVGQKTFYTSPASASLSWLEAQEFCNQNGTVGMRLASVQVEVALELAVKYLASETNIDGFWLSATDFGSEGQFHWTRGGIVLHAVSQDGGRSENCLALQVDGQLKDENCTTFSRTGLWALCEVVSGDEPEPFECREEGKFPDPEHCDVFHQCVWHQYQGEFIDYKFTCPEFTNYCPDGGYCGHPENCPCPASSVAGPAGRQAARVNRAGLEYVGKAGQKEFYTFRPPAPYFNWIESMEFCHANGMMLARMKTEAERGVLLSYLAIGGSGSYRYFWLSAIDYGSEDEYYWFGDGTKLDLPIYGNGGRHSNCLYLASSGPVYDWTCEHHRTSTMYPLCQLEID